MARALLATRRLLAIGLALLIGACATERSSIPRPAPGQRVDPDRARAATDAGDWETAAALWNELFMVGGADEVQSCREAARALMEMGDLDSARAVLELGMRRDPGHPELLEAQGDVLARMGFRRAADAAYSQALEVDPDRPHAMLELARIRVELGRPHQALEILKRRVALGSDDAETHLLKARALAACDRPEEAYAAFVRAFELGEDDPRFLISAACLAFDDRMRTSESCRRQSRAWLEQAVETDPQLTLAHFYLGVLDEQRGDLESARQRYDRAVETDPAHAPSLTRLAGVLDQLDQPEEAARIALLALKYEDAPGRRVRLKRIAGL
jgi:tetratricopeptide (TPR) repeat protein